MPKTKIQKKQSDTKNTFSSSFFLRELLMRCVGTVMIEMDQWNFSDDSVFYRAYFNDRIKQEKAINPRTHKRLSFLFSQLFFPDQRKNSKFKEPQAVDGANGFISLLDDLFHVNFSFLKNTYSADNVSSRKALLKILDLILNLMEDCAILNDSLISDVLLSKHHELLAQSDFSSSAYPVFLNALPSSKAPYFIGRAVESAEIISLLYSGSSCFLHGIGGIGKTELAKDVVKKIYQTPSEESGITHIVWINYIENSFALSLIRGLGVPETSGKYEQLFQDPLRLLRQYGSSLLLVIDHVEDVNDPDLCKVISFLSCRFLISSRMDGLYTLKKVYVQELPLSDCMDLFYYYYHGNRDDKSIGQILSLADCHTVTIELLAKLANTEESCLYEFLNQLKRCGFSFSQEEVSSTHEKLQSEEQINLQLWKLFHVCNCSESETKLLIQLSVLPSLLFDFKKIKSWFHLKNKTDLNRLAEKGWLKKVPCYSNGIYSSQYMIHPVIACAVRTQFQTVLYQTCHSFLVFLTKEILQHRSHTVSLQKELIQFGWFLNDLLSQDFCTQEDAEFLYAMIGVYRDIGYYSRAISLSERLLCLYQNLYGEDHPSCISVYHSLSVLYYETCQIQKALDCSKRCCQFFQKNFIEDSICVPQLLDLAAIQLNIGKIYLNVDTKRAKSYLEHSYGILKKNPGFFDLLTLDSCL